MPQLDLTQILDRAGLGNMIGRDAATLRTEEWQAIDDAVVEAATPLAVARERLAPIIDTSFSGAGWMEVKATTRSRRAPAKRDFDGEPETADLPRLGEIKAASVVTHAETWLKWRQLEASRHGREPLNVSGPQAAGVEVVLSQEELVWGGDADLGVDGALRPTGYSTAAGASWSAGAGAGQVNVYNTLKAMASYLDGNNANSIAYRGRRLLVMSGADAENASARYEDGGGRTPLQEARDSDMFQEVVVLPPTMQPAGRVTIIPLNKAYMTWYSMQDVTTEELPAQGRNVLLSTYAIDAMLVKVGAAVVERTGIA